MRTYELPRKQRIGLKSIILEERGEYDCSMSDSDIDLAVSDSELDEEYCGVDFDLKDFPFGVVHN